MHISVQLDVGELISVGYAPSVKLDTNPIGKEEGAAKFWGRELTAFSILSFEVLRLL